MKQVCLVFKKNKMAKVSSKINAIVFFIYYFGFLIFFDYLALINKDIVLFLFSLLAWVGGIVMMYKKYSKIRKGMGRVCGFNRDHTLCCV